MPNQEELVALLLTPAETLSVEHKSWLNLTELRDRATLAKAAIALANSGGGLVVLGMRATDESDGALHSQARPAGVMRYTTDDVNAAINRYSDPEIHCELAFAVHPDTQVEHAFVIVPGDQSVPVMSVRDYERVISARRCYIRKPGPRSEEPFDSAEWRALLDRCVRSGRENMLDAIRTIVQGRVLVAEGNVDDRQLTQFAEDARARWDELVRGLVAEDPARFPSGHYSIAAQIRGVDPAPTLAELLRRIDSAHQIRHTGWTPFVVLQRDGLAPASVDGAIQVWLGSPDVDRNRRDPAHCDFWRADSAGRFFLMRGYAEDVEREPGTSLDITLPVWRVGEALLFLARVANGFSREWSLEVDCRFHGLRGRVLASISGRRMLWGDRRATDDTAVLRTQVTKAQITDNLSEVLLQLLTPLYERFAFFELPPQLVQEELARMTANRF